MQADAKYRTNVDDMRYFFVRSNNGDMVPLNTLVTDEGKTSSATVTRFNGVRAIKIAGNPATGYSTGQAMTALEETAAEILPTTYTYEWVDQSRDELEAGNRSTQIFIISLIFVFLCLAALYESWTIPLAVSACCCPWLFWRSVSARFAERRLYADRFDHADWSEC